MLTSITFSPDAQSLAVEIWNMISWKYLPTPTNVKSWQLKCNICAICELFLFAIVAETGNNYLFSVKYFIVKRSHFPYKTFSFYDSTQYVSNIRVFWCFLNHLHILPGAKNFLHIKTLFQGAKYFGLELTRWIVVWCCIFCFTNSFASFSLC